MIRGLTMTSKNIKKTEKKRSFNVNVEENNGFIKAVTKDIKGYSNDEEGLSSFIVDLEYTAASTAHAYGVDKKVFLNSVGSLYDQFKNEEEKDGNK